MPDTPLPEAGLFSLGGAVFARRNKQILILKRGGGGEMGGAWYIPGGGVEAGEAPDVAALRELREEAGIVPTGPLTLIGVIPMRVYGNDSLQVIYAADCDDGDVVLSDEHTGFRWIDPREYRDRYFGDEQIQRVAEGDPRRAAIVAGVRKNLDAYIAWADHAEQDRFVKVMGMTADMFLVRDGELLFLRRHGGLGSGSFYLPGGVVEHGEQPLDGAIRETLEETGLHVPNAELLRSWSWKAQYDRNAYHSLYIAAAPAGDVALSNEHSDFRWMPPEEYAAMLQTAAATPAFALFETWFPQVLHNLELARAWIDAHPDV